MQGYPLKNGLLMHVRKLQFFFSMQVRRLHKFGVTRGELARYLNALLKDSEHLAAMIDNVPSVDNLDFIMESDALSHTVMDQQQGHESLSPWVLNSSVFFATQPKCSALSQNA
jgi:hypothetical protein